MRRALVPAGAAGLLLLALLLWFPRETLAGWRAVFLAVGAVPVGATVLLLIARVTGADWTEALAPLARTTPLLLPAFVPVVIQQALLIDSAPHPLWLAWPAFGLRGIAAIGLWWWLSHLAIRGRLSVLAAALGLVAHGIAVTVVGTDWILGASPGQPQSAIGMVLVTMEVLAACAAACLLGSGPAGVRRDLSRLLLAGGLGLGYLLFMDYLIVWYGNLPTRVGWYLARGLLPWRLLPSLALLAALAVPIVAVGFGRSARPLRIAGGSALVGVLLVAVWQVCPPLGTPPLSETRR